jgi:hypothetical protein
LSPLRVCPRLVQLLLQIHCMTRPDLEIGHWCLRFMAPGLLSGQQSCSVVWLS